MSNVIGVTTVIGKKKSKAKPNTLKSLAYVKITGPTCTLCGNRVYKLDDPMHQCVEK